MDKESAAAEPLLPPPDAANEPSRIKDCLTVSGLVLFQIAFFALCVNAALFFFRAKPQYYSVAVDHADGLDMSLDAIDPVFNLTVRAYEPAAPRGTEECFDRGSKVEVSYRGVILGEGPLPELCMPGGTARGEASVAARGRGVRLPWRDRDSLADEMRRGAARLEVSMKVLLKHCAECMHMVFCTAGLEGAVLAPCTVVYSIRT